MPPTILMPTSLCCYTSRVVIDNECLSLPERCLYTRSLTMLRHVLSTRVEYGRRDTCGFISMGGMLPLLLVTTDSL